MEKFKTHSSELVSKKEGVLEIIKSADVVFVLAQGNPPEDKLTMEARFRTLAAVEAKEINPNLQIVFVGGHVEKFKTTSQQMRDYFIAKSGSKGEIVTLDESNNTVGNINEVMKYLEEHKGLKNVMIISSESHLNRVSKILKDSTQEYNLVPMDFLVDMRSKKHNELLDKYQNSLTSKKESLMNKVMMLYLKVDPEYKLPEKFRRWSRNRKEEAKKQD